MNRLMSALDDQCGFCIGCGNRQKECKPDMRRVVCESCHDDKVYGAEELMLQNWATAQAPLP